MDDVNVPPLFKKDWLESGQALYTASEMTCLMRNLPLIIGDLIPRGNEFWKLFLLLRKLLLEVMVPKFTQENIKELEILIREHHSLYKKLVGPLKPKHHFIIHYPNLMRKLGPMKFVAAVRFEGKHKPLKDYAKAMTSRVNPAYSLAIKQQLELNYRLIQNKGFEMRVSFGTILHEKWCEMNDYDSFKYVIPKIHQ